MFEVLQRWDTHTFYKINTLWTTPFLDHVFPWWRDAITWYPVYLFLLFFILINFGWKAWTWIAFLVLNIVITDQFCSTVLKHWFPRLRPCNDPFMHGYVRMLINHCGLGNSFPSAHATNHFSAACFLFFTLKSYFKNWSYLFFLWAATISYGQIYVGLHYPLDVVSGAIIGSAIGCIMAYIYNTKIKLPDLVTGNALYQ